jgi:hypothetical protein
LDVAKKSKKRSVVTSACKKKGLKAKEKKKLGAPVPPSPLLKIFGEDQ